MVGFLRGNIISKRMGMVIVDVNGVGYQVLVPASVIEQSSLDSEVSLFTHLAVREDALTLYGFATEEERDVYELLVGISGIGPKIGLAILSSYSPAEIQSAVSGGNAAAFSAVSGIGKKNAERIVLELKNKVWSTAAFQPMAVPTSSELSQALAALGYTGAEVAKVSQEIDANQPLTDQIKQALGKLGGR